MPTCEPPSLSYDWRGHRSRGSHVWHCGSRVGASTLFLISSCVYVCFAKLDISSYYRKRRQGARPRQSSGTTESHRPRGGGKAVRKPIGLDSFNTLCPTHRHGPLKHSAEGHELQASSAEAEGTEELW